MPLMNKQQLHSVLGLGLGVALSGCASDQVPFEVRPYPGGQGQLMLDEAQVQRSGIRLRVVNGSSQAIGPGTMWVNQEFSHPVASIGAGATVELDLSEFRNEFGERFRAGGFWATERPKRLGLVQVEPPSGGMLIGLVVIEDEPK